MKIKISKKVILILFFVVLAFVLRTTVALNLNINADEAVYATRGVGIIEAGRLSTLDQSPIYFYMLDVGYKFFGVNAFSSRLPGILFGSLAVIFVYLIGKEFYDRKKAIAASFLFAISGFSFVLMIELDMFMTFFVLFSIYFFIRGLKYDEKYLLWSAIFLGIAVLIKSIALLVIPAYAVYYLVHNKKIKIDKKSIKIYALCILLGILIVSPILAYNYLLYKDKGISDIYFSQYFDVNKEVYSGLNIEKGWNFGEFFNNIKAIPKDMLVYDALLLIFSLLGIILSTKNKKEMNWFFLIIIAVPLIFLLGTTSSRSHYIYFFPIFCIFAAEGIFYITEKIKYKKIIFLILLIVFITNIFLARNELTNGAAIVELRSAVEEMPENSLVVYDARIYTGLASWALNDKHYLSSSYLNELLGKMNQLPGESRIMPVYFIECVKNDCAWGRGMLQNKEMQESSEKIVVLFENDSEKIGEFYDDYLPEKPHTYTIYKKEMAINEQVFSAVDSTHEFYYYPVGWKTDKEIFDDYETHNILDSLVNLIAKVMLYISLIIALFSIFYAFYLLVTDSNSSETKEIKENNKDITVTNAERP